MLHQLHAAAARLRELFRRRSHSTAEQNEEFAFHLEMETAENIRCGITEAEARHDTFLRTLLYEVTPTGVAEFGLATVLLLLVTLVATLVPARRAARTQPAVVLRGE